MTPQDFVDALAERIGGRAGDRLLRVAVTGVDGVGKTLLADVLALRLEQAGHAVIRASIDGFHNPRAIRYARGRHDPEGFFRDSFNLDRFREDLLDPLSPGGSRLYRAAVFDHRTDSAVPGAPHMAPERGIVLIDGIFLLQPALLPYWDLTILLEAPPAASFARMAMRDGSDPDPEAQTNRRYRDGQALYIKECRPQERADIRVDYVDVNDPRIVKG